MLWCIDERYRQTPALKLLGNATSPNLTRDVSFSLRRSGETLTDLYELCSLKYPKRTTRRVSNVTIPE